MTVTLTNPTVGADADTWGTELNTALDAIETWSDTVLLKAGGTMTGALVSAAGTVSAPGMSFASDLDCGFYRIGANYIGLALNGIKQVDFTTTGVAFTGTLSATTGTFTTGTFTGLVLTTASASGASGFRLPHGSAPSSPTNGDVWTTTAGLYARINGATVGPYTAATGSYLATANNLSDLASASTARTNLGLGSLATLSAVGSAQITDGSVALGDMANLAQARVIGRASGAGTGAPTALTEAQLSALVDLSAATMGTGSGLSGEFKIGPLEVKCGSVSVDAAQNSTTGEGSVSFVDAFPTAILAAVATPSLSGGVSGGNNLAAYIRGASTSGMNVGLDQDGTGTNTGITVYWAAVGY